MSGLKLSQLVTGLWRAGAPPYVVFQSVAISFDLNNEGVMQDAIEHGCFAPQHQIGRGDELGLHAGLSGGYVGRAAEAWPMRYWMCGSRPSIRAASAVMGGCASCGNCVNKTTASAMSAFAKAWFGKGSGPSTSGVIATPRTRIMPCPRCPMSLRVNLVDGRRIGPGWAT